MTETPTPKRLTEREAFGLALKRLRRRAELTQEQAAERVQFDPSDPDVVQGKVGVAPGSWRRYEKGLRDLSLEKWTALADAVGASRDDLMLERARVVGDAPPAREPATIHPFPRVAPQIESVMLPVRDRAQAGAWLAADDTSQVAPRSYPAVKDPRFAYADQWLTEVVGDSLDLLSIFSGDLVHVVDATAIGYYPKTGDILEVERLRHGGAERELSLKEVELTPGGVILWPRSSNPRWREPLSLIADTSEDEEFEVRVRGLVLAAIRRL